MSRMFRVLAILSISLFGLGFMAGRTSAAETLPSTQNWDSVYPWSQVYGGSALDTTQSAPGSESTSLKFTYPQEMYNGTAPDKVWVKFTGQNELWTRYSFKYSSNFYFHPIDNKQAYWYIAGSLLSTNWYVSCSSNRKMRMVYQRGSFGSGTRSSNTMNNPTIERDVWYEITTRVVLNTGGKANGIIQMWVNGQLVMNYDNVPYLAGPDVGKNVDVMAFDPVFGGMAGKYKPATDFFWVDHTIITTDPLAPIPPPMGKTPTPPLGLRF